MLISLDYDSTFTLDPQAWTRVCECLRSAGHTVICVTGRKKPPEAHEPKLPPGMVVVCAGERWKRDAAERAGFKVDVWIDDMPELIAPSKVLTFDEFKPRPWAHCPTHGPETENAWGCPECVAELRKRVDARQRTHLGMVINGY